MRIQFKVEYRPQIESGEYKVVTDCGEPVEIVKWDCKGKCPILAVIDDGDTSDSCFFTEKGCSLNEKDWLYIDTNEPVLTEFEQEIVNLIEEIDGDYAIFMQSYDKYIEKFAPAIMKAAEKEMHEKTNGNYAWLIGKEDAYKNMPKWKKVEADVNYPPCLTREFDVNGDYIYSLSSGRIYDGCEYILVDELSLKLKREE